MNQKLSHKQLKRNKGFTIVEFVVIIIIFATVAAISLFDFKGFTRRIRLENLAQTIALTVREAQVLGSTRTSLQADPSAVIATGYSGVFIPYDSGSGFGYGTLPTTGDSVQNSFVLFDDVDQDPTGNPFLSETNGVADIVRDVLTLDSGDRIISITVGDNADPATHTDITSDFYIVFKRPSLNARLYEADDNTTTYQYAHITIADEARTEERTIQITAAGQISVLSVVQ